MGVTWLRATIGTMVGTTPARMIFLAHRWPLLLDEEGRMPRQASQPVAWPGGGGHLSIASGDPTRQFFGAILRLEALDAADKATHILDLTEPQTSSFETPPCRLRLVAEGGSKAIRMTATINRVGG
jgi:hypothetical protein